MADKSSIEWTEATWNPVVGCTHVSPGCDNCYAAREASGRLSRTPLYAGLAKGGKFTGATRLVEERLSKPLRWGQPRMVFVNSMSDLFHDTIPDSFIAEVFATMALAPRHTFQVLTKRQGRMRSLLNRPDFEGAVQGIALERSGQISAPWRPWPLPNVWLGVSVEDQHWADIRIPALLETPAAVRWISAEPLLGPIELCFPRLDWVVVGGESGPGARPMHPDWARSLRDDCAKASVPFFFKQWGGRTPKAGGRELDGRTWDEYPEVSP